MVGRLRAERVRWADTSGVSYLVTRYSCRKRRYLTLGGRFETYGEAETYAAGLHDQSARPDELRFIPMSEEAHRVFVGADGVPLR